MKIGDTFPEVRRCVTCPRLSEGCRSLAKKLVRAETEPMCPGPQVIAQVDTNMLQPNGTRNWSFGGEFLACGQRTDLEPPVHIAIKDGVISECADAATKCSREIPEAVNDALLSLTVA